VQSVKETGLGLLLAGIVVTLVPQVVGLIAGRMMKMEPVILLGALAGAQTVNAASNALTDEAQSDTPNLGFTVPYAIGNVLLTIWGPVIVGIV
jgi:putative transport protein